MIVLIPQLAAQATKGEISRGQPAPAFVLNDLGGNEVTSADLAGNFVVIHIATTWCPYCNAEAPYLEKIAQDYIDRNVKVLIIDVREPKSIVQSKLQDRFNFSFPVLLDNDGSVAASFAPANTHPDLAKDEIMIAANILIDPDGNIQFLTLLDSMNFDSELTALKARLNVLLNAG